MGSSLSWATGAGREGIVAGSLRKKASFSAESFTASVSRNAIVSTSLFFSTLDSASFAGFRRRVGADASSRW